MNGNLDRCTICGGRLDLVDGTDPEIAERKQRWSETYRCTRCGGTGTYHVDERNGISERFGGVCREGPA